MKTILQLGSICARPSLDPVRSFMNGCFQVGRRSFGRASIRLARQLSTWDGASARRLRAPNHEISRNRGGGERPSGRLIYREAITWRQSMAAA
jgi:hypothetical protein